MNRNMRWFCLPLIAALCAARPSWGQEAEPPVPPPRAAVAETEYETIVIPETILAAGKETPAIVKINSIVKKAYQDGLSEADKSSFDNYFTRYQFALMTQTDEKSLANLPKARATFFRLHLNPNPAIKKQEVHDHLVQLTFQSMKEIATKNYHPAARYNAMVIIGELNSREAVLGGANATLPLPYFDALEFMMAEALNPEQIDAVRVAALVGVLRHVDLNAFSTQAYGPEVRQGYLKQIMPLALDKKVPADRSPEGHAWLRGRAIEIVAALGQAGFEPTVIQALNALVADAKEPQSIRFVAAQGLGRLNMTAGANLPADEMARKLGELLIESSKQQLAILEDELNAEKEKLKLLGGGGIEGGRGIPVGPRFREGPEFGDALMPVKFVKLEQRISLQQRLLKDRAYKVQLGLEGPEGKTGTLSGAKDAAKQTYVTNVKDAVFALRKVADMKGVPDKGITTVPPPKMADLAKEMKIKITDLERVVKTGGAPAAPVPMPATPEGPEEGPDVTAKPPVEAPDEPAAPAKKKAPAEELPE